MIGLLRKVDVHMIILKFSMKTVKVIDSIMGSGKTSWAMGYIDENSFGKNYIYITPYLDEIERVKSTIAKRHFYDPLNSGEGKLEHLKELINEGHDIVTTHALFQRADEELIALIEAGNYTLILDEVMNVVQQVPLKKNDYKLLLENDIIYLQDGCVRWNNNKGYDDTKYNNIREMANLGTLMYHRENALMWTFPVEVFRAFDEVYILTYYFKAQFQRYYYDLFEIEYEYYSVKRDGERYILIPKEENVEDRSIYHKLVTIYEGKLNDVGKLSKTWMDDNPDMLDKLKRNTQNYFRNIVKAKSNECLWTIFKEKVCKLQGKGYTKGFLSCNARATNEYAHKTKLAYLLNRYMPVMEKGFFVDKGICVDEGMWALSELLQWIWRSAIRNNGKIDIYIPSARMRGLLYDWLDGKI
jgi:hypothetical protein